MAQTKPEIRAAWSKEHLATYAVRSHKGKNAEAIAYIEARKAAGKKTSDIFREAIEALMEKESGN